MIKKLVELELLEKGDKVLLPSGEAIVMEDEKSPRKPPFNRGDRFYGEVKIKWIDNCEGKHKIRGGLDSVESAYCSLIKE